jgi:nitrate reductase gamma subunit
MTFLEFTEGPLWYVALVVFVVGVAWNLIAILAMRVRPDAAVARRSPLGGGVKAIFLHMAPHGGFFSRTAYHVIVGYFFHIGLFALLLFGSFHIAFIEKWTGLSWTPLPRWGFIIAAEVAFAGLLLMWIRRWTDPVTRQISDRDDHIGTGLTMLAMLTGCFALAEASDGLRAVHMLSVEALMIYFPFSRLMHAFTFLFSRYFMGAAYGKRGYVP